MENSELDRFYQSLMQEIKATQIAEEDGQNLTQVFTQVAVDLLCDAGETENVIVVYDEGQLGTKNQHQINGYSISDNYETLDLFITIYKGLDNPGRIAKEDIDKASKRILNFFRKGIDKNYVNEIEESSPIFDFARTLNHSESLKENLVRVNAIILVDGLYPGEIPDNQEISNYPVYYRIIDISYLYDITEKSHIPIEIDFKSEGFEIPCIVAPSENEEYQSYLAIIPATALATIYERYGSRLLEQNVRSFLQFTGKINKGIRGTIKEEPHMFLAFNNGLSATAEEVDVQSSENGGGFTITRVKDFQIVNGGQTTASIYHTYKKDKADINEIHVQMKLNVVKNKDKFPEIVSRIAEYANTQNKVSMSDLSSNRPYHIQLEKLSRSMLAPVESGQNLHTRWFYERTRGQYRNARMKEGSSISKRKVFDSSNPKHKVITKEELAKYINSYHEILDGKKKIPIGPHIVVRGNQKNYKSFIDSNLEETINSIYFEDAVAKAILFRSAEKIYGVKPNAIGDLRYITVPYSISLLGFLTNYKLDLHKIWLNQSISPELQKTLRELMLLTENFINSSAPGDLVGEWAKKQECWIAVKEHFGKFEIPIPPDDISDGKEREAIDDEEIEQAYYKEIESKIKSIAPEKWKEIYLYCKESEDISTYLTNIVHNVGRKLKEGIRPSRKEILMVNELLNKIQFKISAFDPEERK